MAIDFTKPATSDNYSTGFVPNIQGNQTELARWLDSSQSTITGTPPTYAKRYNRTSSAVEEYNGTSWAPIVFHGLTYSSGNIGIGGTPDAKLDLLGSVASNPQAIFTRGVTDPKFKLVARNGVTGSASGTVVSQVGLEYDLGGFSAGIKFARGGGATDSILSLWANSAQVLLLDNTRRVGVNAPIPRTTLHVTGSGGTSSGSLSLSPYTTGGGGASYIMMGNSDSAGVSGPSMIVAADRSLQFGVGTDFTSASGGTFTEWARLDKGKFFVATTAVNGITNLGGSSANPNVAATNMALALTGPYGGGLLFVDGTNNWGMFDVAGTLFFGSGASLGALTNRLSLSATGVLTVGNNAGNGTVNSFCAVFNDGNKAGGGTNQTFVRIGRFSGGDAGIDAFQGGVGGSNLAFGTYGTQLLTLAPTGTLSFVSGSTTAGLKLPNASNSSSTTLDWYEEGTFTPTVTGATTAGTCSYSEQTGRFVRIGRLVFINITVGWSSHTGAGFTKINGLPYAAAQSDLNWIRAVGGPTSLAFNSWSGWTQAGQSYLYLQGQDMNSGSNAQRSIVARDQWSIAGFYEV